MAVQPRVEMMPQSGLLAGVDEAGRGPLAGPVVAAAVILDERVCIDGIKDSKQLTARQRGRLASQIRRHASAYSVALADVDEIDSVNILRASLLAMERAVYGLTVTPDIIQVDGRELPRFEKLAGRVHAEPIIRGDQHVVAIGAASILAKVYRDRMMRFWHRRYPQYDFHRNKGYGTPAHLAALKRFGPCPIHRRSFSPVRDSA
jgi:ribonuclease HII